MKQIMKSLLIVLCCVAGTLMLSANEEVVKKTILGSATALADLDVDKSFDYWCPDGFIIEKGKKTPVANMKKSKEMAMIRSMGKILKAGNFEEMVDAMVAIGQITADQKKQMLALPDDKKKLTFTRTKFAMNMMSGMIKNQLNTMIKEMQFKSIEINGDTAKVVAASKNPKTGLMQDEIMILKKINGVWKIYSSDDLSMQKATGK